MLLHGIGFATNSIATIRRELLPHGFALTQPRKRGEAVYFLLL